MKSILSRRPCTHTLESRIREFSSISLDWKWHIPHKGFLYVKNSDSGMLGSKPVSTPLEPGTHLYQTIVLLTLMFLDIED